ncbi:hypothetical protein [Pedobacter sp. Bi27]|nr:hypothetical protein [Pedobacter sp. Bi27]
MEKKQRTARRKTGPSLGRYANMGVPLNAATGFHPSWPSFSAYIVH